MARLVDLSILSILSILPPVYLVTDPTPHSLRCLVVDDDPLAVQLVQNCIQNTPFLELVGSCEDAIKAGEFLRNNPVDLLLLDVEMPLMSGLELLRTLQTRPMVILITSNPNYAVEAFEEDVVDYLVKPISYGRFMKAVQRAREVWEIQQSAGSGAGAGAWVSGPPTEANFTFIKVDSRLVKIPFAEVLYVEALGDYVHLVTDPKKHIVYATMKTVATRFPENLFLRVHRSFIVNIARITAIADNTIYLGTRAIPIGQTYLRDVLKRINQY
ncbi:MAG: response regulator transcription factor [Hymenobacteraceae bacterium]|nr:response regulator transcription factor [Hymenobacteraceae bacterium]